MESARDVVRQTMALVLAGGRGSRLKALTDTRAKPSVYFGGKFRIIDFALSNCVNSGIKGIGVVLADSGFSGYLRVKDILPMLESMYHKFQKEDFLEMCKKYGCRYVLVKNTYDIDEDTVFGDGEWDKTDR